METVVFLKPFFYLGFGIIAILIVLSLPRALLKCPKCGSHNVKYYEEKKAIFCNHCGDFFRV